ncbi:TolB family protein [Microbulbifer sp. TYP-18]|uniref:TolB family protein n=1 Tax=Microbulbifer sp. TYP-18 TaxID=3230024 RepID=UPI0034C5D990
MKWYQFIKWATALFFSGASSLGLANTIAYLGVADGYWEVWRTDTKGTTTEQLTRLGADVSRISWFPDGKTLLVNLHDGRLFQLDVGTEELTQIPAPLPNILDAVVSPKGDSFAFSLSTSSSIDDNDIYVYHLASKKLDKLTAMPRLQHEPSWSPDGKSIYFLSGDGGQQHDIWKVGVTTRSTEQLTVSALYHFDLAVRHDGVIAYSGNQSGNYELWLRQPNGQTQQLTQDPALDARPNWSPGGDQLVFHSSRDGNLDLWLYDLATEKTRALTQTAEGARQAVWAPAGENRGRNR